MYIEDLKRTVQRIQEARRLSMMSDREIAALVRWSARSVENAAFLNRVRDADAAVLEAEDRLERACRRFGDASVAQQREREALDGLDAVKPSAIKVLSRRQWAEKRRAQQQRVAAAATAEHDLLRCIWEGGPLQSAVAVAKTDRLEQWNRLCEAEASSRTPSPSHPWPQASTRRSGSVAPDARPPAPGRRAGSGP